MSHPSVSNTGRSVTRLSAVIAGAVALLAVGAAGGYFWSRQQPSMAAMSPHADGGATAERKALYWYDPMMPAQHFDKPGKSPFMDMQLVPRYADAGQAGAAGAGMPATGVQVDARLQQSVGIRTATVQVGQLSAGVHVPGTLSWNLREESVVSARAEGIVTHLLVKAPYSPVVRGQALASVLAPSWSTAMAEAQALQQAQSSDARELQAASRQRLRVLGAQGGRSRDGSITLSAGQAGVVSEVLVREGQAVAAGTPLFRINGTASLWLQADVPQASVAGLKPGSPVQARISALPGQVFHGQVEALLPQIDAASRTQPARIVLRNENGALAAGMFADVTLQPSAGPALPLIPSEALIATGDDSRVIVQSADGSFVPVRVQTGRSSDGRTEILSGLSGGERVVVSGQFLIDSEASLSGALQRVGTDAAAMGKPPMGDAAMHDAAMGTMSMPGMSMDSGTAASTTEAAAAAACRVQYWYDPMQPQQHFDKPGKSPFMDMQLVPAYAPGAAADCASSGQHATMEMPR